MSQSVNQKELKVRNGSTLLDRGINKSMLTGKEWYYTIALSWDEEGLLLRITTLELYAIDSSRNVVVSATTKVFPTLSSPSSTPYDSVEMYRIQVNSSECTFNPDASWFQGPLSNESFRMSRIMCRDSQMIVRNNFSSLFVYQ